MIFSCQNIHKAFGEKQVLSAATFYVEEREKVALVGNNGAGKTTLLRIIMGELSPDEGSCTFARDTQVGYLAQYQEAAGENSIWEELLSTKQDVLDMEKSLRQMEKRMKEVSGEDLTSLMESYARLNQRFEDANGYAYKSEIIGVLNGLGFSQEEFDKKVGTLSGGQKTRVCLGKLLVKRPDILFLDEPTNHLDMNSIAWLEGFLSTYPGAVLIVSHDRYFLDKVVTKVVEVENALLTTFTGNYSAYALKKARIRDAQYKEYLNQQREIAHQEAVITKLKSFNREKSIKRAESREKVLSRMERMEKPVAEQSPMRLSLEPRILSGNDVLMVEELQKSFPGQDLFSGVTFTIRRGERVALIGDNGTGKTTMLKIINGLVKPDGGSLRLGAKVMVGYYDQEHHVLDMHKTIFEEISDAYPSLNNTQIRNMLAAFLFTGEDVFKPIEKLSGGERGRVSLAKLMLSEANFLILDEPTNHLDIASREILEEALCSYTGTVLVVSHDRYFLNQVATRILDLTHRAVVNYDGDYDYYLEKKDELTPIYAPAEEEVKKEGQETSGKRSWQQQKEEQAAQRKRENDVKRLEKEIEKLEERDRQIDEDLSRQEVFSDIAKVSSLSQEKAQVLEKLEELYARWEELA